MVNMKLLRLIATLSVVPGVAALGAGTATNVRQLAESRALSFSAVRQVMVAKLAAPMPQEAAAFHGCALRSEWREVAAPAGQALADVLRGRISDGISIYLHARDDDLVWLEPFGFVHGELAIRLETAQGRREFAITPGEKSDSVYAYDTRKHRMYFLVEEPARTMLREALAIPPTPASRHG
jgi:hypothetical protein